MPECNAKEPYGNPYNWCRAYEAIHSEGDNHYCIFHAPKDKKGTSLLNFNRQIKQALREIYSFEGIIFPGDITFEPKDNISQISSFNHTVFHGKACFKGNILHPSPTFKYAEFHDEVDFRECTIREKADLETVTFKEKVKFDGAKFKTAIFYGPSFEKEVRFVAVDIYDQLKFHNVNLEEACFIRTDLRKCDFITCKWFERKGRYVLLDEIELFEKRPIQKDVGGILHYSTLYADVENLYRNLKQNSSENHNQYDYSSWHYSEKEMQRKRLGLNKFKNLSTFKKWFTFANWSIFANWLILSIFNQLCGYGDNFQKAAGRLLLIVMLSSLAMGITGIINEQDYMIALSFSGDISLTRLWEIALTTLEHLTFSKSPEYRPDGQLGRSLILLFKIITPIQVALLGFSLRNRFRR